MYRIMLLNIGECCTYYVTKDMPIKEVSILVVPKATLLLILGINILPVI